jgi:6-pyruvoyltetrahydropterin/6-carboxytetrahydropterin synthase
MPWTLCKRYTFEASHRLRHHDGQCQRLHGHSYVMDVELSGAGLVDTGPKQGMVMDFSDISAVVKPLVADSLDHHHLNDTLDTDSPTAEYIAKWVFDRLRVRFGPLLRAVIVYETDTSAARYEL